MSDDPMKDDSMTPSDLNVCDLCGGLTSSDNTGIARKVCYGHPPLTPKESLTTEQEVEEFRKWNSRGYPLTLLGSSRLLSIVDELMKDLQEEGRASHHYFEELTEARCNHVLLEAKLATAQAQLRRKDEALKEISERFDTAYRTELSDATQAALDGKEGMQKGKLEACQWCKKLVSHLIQITDMPDKHDARICEDYYSKEFPEVDGKEGGM